jgi:hypothetical protein
LISLKKKTLFPKQNNTMNCKTFLLVSVFVLCSVAFTPGKLGPLHPILSYKHAFIIILLFVVVVVDIHSGRAAVAAAAAAAAEDQASI